MIRTPLDMKATTSELCNATWTLAAIGSLYESGIAQEMREPRTVDELAALPYGFSRGRLERVLALAATAGVVESEGGRYKLAEGAAAFAAPPMRASMIGDIRMHL